MGAARKLETRASLRLINARDIDRISVPAPAANDNSLAPVIPLREKARLKNFEEPHKEQLENSIEGTEKQLGNRHLSATIASDSVFTGKEDDVEVGLQYFGKRFLNPLLGRWISADPLAVHAPGEADLNLYAYVHGTVLKNVDPLGLDEGDPQGEGGGGDWDEPASNVETLDEITIVGEAPDSTGSYSGGGGAESYSEAALQDQGTGQQGAPSAGSVESVGGGEPGVPPAVVGVFAAALCPVCGVATLAVAASVEMTADMAVGPGHPDFTAREESHAISSGLGEVVAFEKGAQVAHKGVKELAKWEARKQARREATKGATTVAMTTKQAAQVLKTAPGNFPNMPAFGKALGWGRNGGEAAFARAVSITRAEAQGLGISSNEAFAIRDAYRAVINSSKGAANPTALGRASLMNRVGQLLQ